MKTTTVTITHFCELLLKRLKEFDSTPVLSDAEQTAKTLSFIRELIYELKQFTMSYRFVNAQEEISFFKQYKPQLLSQYYFHKHKFKILLDDSLQDSMSSSVYVGKLSKKMQSFTLRNKDLWQYFISGSEHRDAMFFMRDSRHTKLNADANFSTRFDITLARLQAIQMTRKFLKERAEKQIQINEVSPSASLTWTAQKVELVELIYSLQLAGCFNNATPDVRDLAHSFEKLFNVDLGNFYRTFVALRNRKTGYTSFLDKLKNKLEQRIEEIAD